MTSAERDTVAVIDIGDTITIEKSFAPGTNPASLAQELSVEGIEHSINVNTGHIVTYYTSPTIIVYELILDDPRSVSSTPTTCLARVRLMATPTTLPASFVAGSILTAAELNDLRGAFRVLQVVNATIQLQLLILQALMLTQV
jgi:hypothetical protein